MTENLDEILKEENCCEGDCMEQVSLIDKYGLEFEDSIARRGEEYYLDGKVNNCTKIGDLYVANVSGNDEYTVRIQEYGDELEISCTCPCECNCKHEYATLLAIDNEEYEIRELMPYIEKKELSLEELVRKIPAEALKQYLLSDLGRENVYFDVDALEYTFIDFLPKQDFDYYYNNLYNKFLIKEDENEEYISYYNEIRKYIDAEDYEQAFYIIEAIIEVCHDLGYDIVSDMPELGMYLRIAYRKSDTEGKKIIEKYIMHLVFNQYYNNSYLEDMILSVN